MAQLPLVYKEIKRDLLHRLGREWPAGSRLPAVPELARQIGAGQSNTLRAVRELAKEGYLASRRRRGTFVSQRVNELQTKVGVLTGTRIGVALRTIPSPAFIQEMVDSLVAELQIHGAVVETMPRPLLPDFTSSPFAALDAVVIVNPGPMPVLASRQQKILMLSTTQCIDSAAAANHDLVAADEAQGGFLAARRLRASGCTSAGFVGMKRTDLAQPSVAEHFEPASLARLRGFEAGWGEPLPDSNLYFGKAYGEVSGAKAMSDYLSRPNRPQGIFVASDELAMGFVIGGLTAGVDPRRDYQLVSFDAQYRDHPRNDCPILTAVAPPMREMGRRGAQVLAARLTQPDRPTENLRLACSIFEGDTTRPPADPA